MEEFDLLPPPPKKESNDGEQILPPPPSKKKITKSTTGGEKSTVVAEQATQPSGESGGTVEAAVEVESLPTNYDRLSPKSYSNLKDGTNYFTGSIRNGNPVVKKWDAAAQEFQTQNDPAITELAQQKFGKPNQLTPVEEQKDIARKELTAKSDTGSEIILPETSEVLEKAGVATYLNKDKIADEAAVTYNRTKSIAQQPQVSTYMQMFDLYKNTDDPTIKDDIEKQLEELKSKPFNYNEINSAVEGKDNPSLQPLMPSIPELKTVGDAVNYAMSQMEENKALIDDYTNTENDLLKINEEYQKLSPQDPKGFWYNAIRAVNEHTEALDRANKIALNSDQGAMEELENSYIKSKIFPTQPTEGLGTAGELAGGMAAAVAPTVVATMAATSLTGNPIAGMIAGGVYSAQDMARLQYANGFQEMYNEVREKNPNLPPNIAYETAKDYAKQTAGVQGTVGVAVGMFLPALRTESVLAQKASSQIAKQFFVDIAKNSGFDFGVGASSQMLNNYIGKNLGSDRSIFDGALESGGMMAVQGLMVGTVTGGFPAVSKYVTAKDRENAVNFLANSAPEKLETVFGNAIKNGSSPIEIQNLRDEVMNRMAAFSQMPPNLSAEKKIKLAPLYEERNRLATHLKDNPASEMGVMPEIERIDRQIAEEAGFPLTEKEAKRLEDLNAIAKDKEDRLTPTEIKERNHLRKRNTKAEKEAAKEEVKPAVEKETPVENVAEGGVEEPVAEGKPLSKVDANINGQKKLFGKDKVGDGLDDLMEAIGGIKKAAGGERPDAVKALRKIVEGLYEQGGVSAKNILQKIKELLKEKYGNVDLKKIDTHEAEVIEYARQLEKKSFIETVKNSAKTTEEFKAKVDEIEENYQVLTNKEAIAKADAQIGLDLGEVKKKVMSTSIPPSAEKSVLAMRLMKHYEKIKDFDSAIEVLNSYDQQLREAGRFIQAASLWNKISPEVVVRNANKVAEELGMKLTPEVSKMILEQMSKVDAMPEGVEKQKATLEVLDYIATQLPLRWSEYLEAYRYQNMLSNPRSHERNIYSNMFNQLITRPFDLATLATYDYLRHPLNPVAREVSYRDVPKYYKELITSIPNAWAGFSEAITSGYISDKVMDMGSTTSKIEALRRSKLPKVFTLSTRFLEAQDSFFSIMIAQGEKSRLMRTGVSEKLANKAASDLANDYLYRSKLGNAEVIKNKPVIIRALDAAGVFTNQLRKAPVIGKAAGYFIPFVTTPINVAKFGLERSPAGFLGGDYNREQLAKATVGSVIMGAGALAAAQGLTTWAAPKDKKERELFYASGRKPYSIRMGGKWVPLTYAGPYAFALAMPAALKHYQEDTKEALTDSDAQKVGSSIMSMMGFITSQTSLSGVDTFFKTLMGDPDHNLMQSLGFTSEQFLPLIGMVKYINSIYDPIYRKAHGYVEAIEKDLPILSEELDAYTDENGNPSRRDPINYALPYDLGLNKEQLELPLMERRKAIQNAEKFKQDYLKSKK